MILINLQLFVSQLLNDEWAGNFCSTRPCQEVIVRYDAIFVVVDEVDQSVRTDTLGEVVLDSNGDPTFGVHLIDVVKLYAAFVLPPHNHAQVSVSYDIAANLVLAVFFKRLLPQA